MRWPWRRVVTVPRLSISDRAAETLTEWANQLLEGQLSFGQLPLEVEALVHLGYALGRQARQHEIDALEREVNFLHYQLIPEPERKREIEQRLLERLGRATADDLDQIEALLHGIKSSTTGDDASSPSFSPAGRVTRDMRDPSQRPADTAPLFKRSGPAILPADEGQQCQQHMKNFGMPDPNLRPSNSGQEHAA